MPYILLVILWMFLSTVQAASDKNYANQTVHSPQLLRLVEPQMILIPEGKFKMGSPDTEKERDSDEGPQHIVHIKSFMLGKYEVTRGEFAEFINLTGHVIKDPCFTNEENSLKPRKDRGWKNPGFSQTDKHPVVCVSWYDAKAYTEWLTRITGKDYRLPTEAEWEYAARARTDTARYWGEDIDKNRAHCSMCGDNSKFAQTLAVGTYASNPFGLYDMLGNVWEWVADCGHQNYMGAPVDGSAWNTGNCSIHPVRGGSWSDNPWLIRSAARSQTVGQAKFNYLGFRVARTVH